MRGGALQKFLSVKEDIYEICESFTDLRRSYGSLMTHSMLQSTDQQVSNRPQLNSVPGRVTLLLKIY